MVVLPQGAPAAFVMDVVGYHMCVQLREFVSGVAGYGDAAAGVVRSVVVVVVGNGLGSRGVVGDYADNLLRLDGIVLESACTVLEFGMDTPAGIVAVEVLRRNAVDLRNSIYALCERLSIYPLDASELSARKVSWFVRFGFRDVTFG
ncbi:hypothetical protein QBC45DRAFT_391961 [Copromyces sp. CBS 386.78]|nr:hypothetical protein QBC45DRAFT_391961 [Copromyces sp. CBS 386.78]